jgi:hypothetical protein
VKVREAPLPPDLQYCLDGGVEYGHITGGVHVACNLFADIAELDRVHSIPHPGTRGWESTAAMCAEVEAYGQSLIAQIDDPALKVACLAASTTSFLRGLSDYGEYICGQAFEDALWGGSLIQSHAVRFDRRGRVYRRLHRKMHTDGWIKRAVRAHHLEDGYRHLIKQHEIIGDPLPPVTAEGFELLNETLNRQRDRANERSRAWLREHAPAIRKESKRQRHNERRSLIRAATLASAIVGASAVSAFARGEPVRLPADNIVFEISPGGSVNRHGHGALTVVLKDNADVYLGKMCIYQQKLPALDQLASLALHIQSGEVAEVLASGNLFNASPAAFAHPLLAGKKPPPLPADLAEWEQDHLRLYRRDDYETRRLMLIANEAIMGDRFRHRVFLDVLGRGAPAAWSMFERLREANL